LAVRRKVLTPDIGVVLSPSQAATFLQCSAKWWFKYGLLLPEPKTASLAFGLAVHRTLEVNFRQKLETGTDLETAGMVAVFRDAWMEQIGEVEFREDEDPLWLRCTGEHLIRRYMDEIAPRIQPAAVELDVSGEIGAVAVRGRVDLLDRNGTIVDTKTAHRRPACVSPDYAFQLATYSRITPGATGQARLDTLVKTATPQLVQLEHSVTEQERRGPERIYPLVQEGMRSGLYFPSRQSVLCSRRYCAFWKHCEREFGGTVKEA
jgi:hypothetical protein